MHKHSLRIYYTTCLPLSVPTGQHQPLPHRALILHYTIKYCMLHKMPPPVLYLCVTRGSDCAVCGLVMYLSELEKSRLAALPPLRP